MTEVAKELRSRCTEKLREQGSPHHPSISDSITTAGYFEHPKADSSEALARADRCKKRNDDLLPLRLPDLEAGDRGYRRTDMRLLKKRVEEWSLQALLVTERPRALWIGRLPKLTCTYRFYLFQFSMAGVGQDDNDEHPGDKAVRWDEFVLSKRNAGFRSEAQREVIKRFCKRDRWHSARELVAGLDTVGLLVITGTDAESDEERQKVITMMEAEMQQRGAAS